MNRQQIELGAVLLDALESFAHVREGLKEKTQPGCKIFLELSAYEHEGKSGGCGHGNVLLPTNYAKVLLALAEQKELGVNP